MNMVGEDMKEVLTMLKAQKDFDEATVNDIIENMNDNYDKFWYYLDIAYNPPTTQGPHTRIWMQELRKSNTIEDSTLVWHPLLNKWKPLLYTKQLYKLKKEPYYEVVDLLMSMRTKNNFQPVYLKQGYLHVQSNKHKDRWKSRWIVMTATSIVIYNLPGGKVKKELPMNKLEVWPSKTVEKHSELTMAIKVNDEGKTVANKTIMQPPKRNLYFFWSPFQKEIFEWIIELRKLIWLGGNAALYIVESNCSYDETNLYV